MSAQSLTPAEVRLAQYGERTKTWSTATYDNGTEKALHEIALDLKGEMGRLRQELDRAREDVAFLERATLPELRRTVEHHKDGKQRWRDRAEKAEAEVEQWRATFGADALPGALKRLQNADEEIQRLKARVDELDTALAATGRSLSSFVFDSDDPGADALGAQWLYHQARPNADDPFAQPRAFRSSVFSEAAKAVEEMDGQAPDDEHGKRPQSYLDGYSDGLEDAAERLEKLADQAAEGSDAAR
jgi:archaellum component FlaC